MNANLDLFSAIDPSSSMKARKKREFKDKDPTHVCPEVAAKFATQALFDLSYQGQSAGGAAAFVDDDDAATVEAEEQKVEAMCDALFSGEWHMGAVAFERLHYAVLEAALEALQSIDRRPDAQEEKAEVLQWLFQGPRIGGRPARNIPFSFVNCCRICGYDPDELQRDLLNRDLVRKLLVAFHMVRPDQLPPKAARYADLNPEAARLYGNRRVYQFADGH